MPWFNCSGLAGWRVLRPPPCLVEACPRQVQDARVVDKSERIRPPALAGPHHEHRAPVTRFAEAFHAAGIGDGLVGEELLGGNVEEVSVPHGRDKQMVAGPVQ